MVGKGNKKCQILPFWHSKAKRIRITIYVWKNIFFILKNKKKCNRRFEVLIGFISMTSTWKNSLVYIFLLGNIFWKWPSSTSQQFSWIIKRSINSKRKNVPLILHLIHSTLWGRNLCCQKLCVYRREKYLWHVSDFSLYYTFKTKLLWSGNYIVELLKTTFTQAIIQKLPLLWMCKRPLFLLIIYKGW